MADLGKGDAARHRRARVRAMLAGEAVDVEGDVHGLRQRGDDALAHRGPGGTAKLHVAQALVVEGVHAALRSLGEGHLARTNVADAHLHQLAHLGETRHHVVEDAGVTPGEALERLTQVGVCVDLQDAETGVALRELVDEAEGAGVITAQQCGDGAAIENAARFGGHERVHALAGGVHGCKRLRMLRVAGLGATRVNDGFGGGARLLRQRGDRLRNGQHGDARLPDGAELDVLQIHLLAGLQHMLGARGGAGAIAGGCVEGNGDHHHARVVGRGVETEQAVTGGGGIGVEAGGHDGGGQRGVLLARGATGVLRGHGEARVRHAALVPRLHLPLAIHCGSFT